MDYIWIIYYILLYMGDIYIFAVSCDLGKFA